MAGLHRPGWTRRDHPVVRFEAGHWARSRPWRLLRRLLWVGALFFIVGPGACAVLFALASQITNPPEAILVLGGFFTLGLALCSGLAVWFVNLSATILGATLIARERESQTWPFLRLTSLTSREIVGGKFMALFYTLLGPIQLITGLRVLALLAGLVTLGLAYLASRVTGPALGPLLGPFFDQFNLSSADWLGVVGVGALAGLWTLFNWLFEPLFGLVYYGVIGLAGSTLARSRGGAIVLVFAAHFCLALGLYAPVSQISSLFLAPLAVSGAQDATGAFVVVAFGLQFVIQTLLPWAVVAACALFALRRVETLSE